MTFLGNSGSIIMKKKLVFLILLISMILSGCIDLIEEIDVHKDQSGHISYRIETNEVGGLLNSLSGLIDLSFEDQLKEKADEYAKALHGKKGIENVQFTSDRKTGKYELSFDFSTSQDLNSALYEVAGYKRNLLSPHYINLTKHKIKKINFAPWIKKYLVKENIEIPSEEFLDLVQFTSIVNIPEVATSVRNKKSRKAENGMQITLTNSLTDVINNKVDVGNRIKF